MLSLKGGFELSLSRIIPRTSSRYLHRAINVGDVNNTTRPIRRKKLPLPSRIGETLEERNYRLQNLNSEITSGNYKVKPSSALSNQNTTNFSKQYDQFLESHRSTNTTQELFIARDNHGNEITMDQYMKEVATLSPWVGSPDAAIRKCFDMAKASSTDIHYELGCGDGRLCFYAIDPPYSVKKSIGIDSDGNLIQNAWTRVAKRHPKPQNIDFITTDLLDIQNETSIRVWEKIRDECTILTMFFAEEGLQKLKPIFETYLKGSKVKVITIGYPMKGWKTTWEEVVLDLRIHLYVMNQDMIQDDMLASDDISEYSVDTTDMGIEESTGISNMKAEDQFVSNEEKGPPLQRLEYDPNEDVEQYWDDFDEVGTKDNQVGMSKDNVL